MGNHSYENEFYMQFHFHANQTHFHKNGFALRLALKQRHKGTRKWPTATTGVHNGIYSICFLHKVIALCNVSFWKSIIPYQTLACVHENLCITK